jgi:hypothetical protein
MAAAGPQKPGSVTQMENNAATAAGVEGLIISSFAVSRISNRCHDMSLLMLGPHGLRRYTIKEGISEPAEQF